jgi:hypothetical protein
MSCFTRGPAKIIEQENNTQIPSEIFNYLSALEVVHANFSGMKDSLSDAGKLHIHIQS